MMITPTQDHSISESLADNDVVLSIENVSKKFCRSLKRSLLYGVKDIGTEILGLRQPSSTLRSKEFWALQNITLELRRGQALGLVGVNGSGKTTLLRMIGGLIRPDNGMIRVRGKLAPLIALGAGFNPVLTGRENIYANMSILGLSTQAIDDRFDQVIHFADIGDAIDSPVHSYSSGMAARLGFSCAIHTEPDILLIDEVLAVGDTKFREKCFRRLHELRQKGTAFILVSHNSFHILTVCQQSAYLRRGELLGYGDSADIIKRYEDDLDLEDHPQNLITTTKTNLDDEKKSGLMIAKVYFQDRNMQVVETPVSGEPIALCVNCKIQKPLHEVYFTININGAADEGKTTLHFSSYRDKQPLNLTPGNYDLQLQMPYLGLRTGIYNLNIYASEGPLNNLDSLEGFRFAVQAQESMSRNLFYQPRSWCLAKNVLPVDHQSYSS